MLLNIDLTLTGFTRLAFLPLFAGQYGRPEAVLYDILLCSVRKESRRKKIHQCKTQRNTEYILHKSCIAT